MTGPREVLKLDSNCSVDKSRTYSIVTKIYKTSYIRPCHITVGNGTKTKLIRVERNPNKSHKSQARAVRVEKTSPILGGSRYANIKLIEK